MTITYRTTGSWGSGKGSNLTETELDTNFYTIDQKLTSVESTQQIPNVIQSISQQNNELTFTLTDSTSFGPFKSPTVSFVSKGFWLPDTIYDIGNIVYVKFDDAAQNSYIGFYFINKFHTSDEEFDPTKTLSNAKVYHQISAIQYFNQLTVPSFPATIEANTLLKYKTDIYLTLESISPTNGSALDTAITNGKVINLSNIDRITFNNLADVTAYTNSDVNKYIKLNSIGDAVEYGTPTFSNCADTPSSFVGNTKKLFRVNSSAGGYEYKTFNFTDLNDTFFNYSGLGSRLVRVKSNETGLETVVSPGSTFVSKTDVPQSYANQANKLLKVNSGATGLEFGGSTFAFNDLSDVPQAYTGAANKYVAVNSSTNGLEFIDGVNGNPKSTLNYKSSSTAPNTSNVEFLNIPITARRIYFIFSNMRMSGSAYFLLQLGSDSTWYNTGYTTAFTTLRTGLTQQPVVVTAGFPLYSYGNISYLHGVSTISLCDDTNKIWVNNFVFSLNEQTSYYHTVQGGGSKSLGAGVDVTRVRVISSNGTDTIVGGTLNLAYE